MTPLAWNTGSRIKIRFGRKPKDSDSVVMPAHLVLLHVIKKIIQRVQITPKEKLNVCLQCFEAWLLHIGDKTIHTCNRIPRVFKSDHILSFENQSILVVTKYTPLLL